MYRVSCVPGLHWCVTLTTVLLTSVSLNSCGENPSFTESKEMATTDGLKNGTDSPGDSHVATDSDPSGRTMPCGEGCTADTGSSNESSTSTGGTGGASGGGSGTYPPVVGPYQPNNVLTGTEGGGNLTYVHDISSLKTINKVDILWVVDSSGSMSEEQSYLGTNFRSFISSLATSNSDFQVGVTTTDICSDQNPGNVPMNQRWCPTLDGSSSTHLRGSLVGNSGRKVLKPATANLNTVFTQYANVGVNGSSFEHGLKAAEMAVTKSLTGQNEGLVRSDAFLAVIVVSDEEDDGIGLGKTDSFTGINYVNAGLTTARYTDDNLLSYLTTTKGAGMFSVSAITGTRQPNGQMCTSPHSQPQEEGTQYINAARKSGGIIQSICDTNWSTSLASIGRDINAQSSQILLSKLPYVGTVRVYVNDVESTDWTYTSASNSIKFNSGHVPPSGSKIDIAYWNGN